MRMQTALNLVFPSECLTCAERVEADFALCPRCWADADFVVGAACDTCGVPLPGHADPGATLICDTCRRTPRPWARGRAVFAYGGTARSLVLGLKYADRADIARAAGPWLARAGRNLLAPDTAVIPVPLHRLRLLKRRYNQAALLAQSLGRETGAEVIVDALRRTRATQPLDGMGVQERADMLAGSMAVTPRRAAALKGRPVLVIDDVMTSGATLAAAAEAVLAVGAGSVCVMVLARATLGP